MIVYWLVNSFPTTSSSSTHAPIYFCIIITPYCIAPHITPQFTYPTPYLFATSR